jgi:hypothetical protein
MIDLGQTFYEEKRYFFNRLTVHQIVMNPRMEGYPPAFLICKEMRGSQPCEYAVGLSFLQLNRLLMRRVANTQRLSIAERLADAILQKQKTETIRMSELLGQPLRLNGIDATMRLRRFVSAPQQDDKPLYYFQLTESKL